MSTNEHRIASFGRILSQIVSKLKDDRDWHQMIPYQIEKEADAPDWMVKRTFLMIQEKGFVVRGAKNSSGVVRLAIRVPMETLMAVTGKDIYDWNYAYNQNSRERSEKKKQLRLEIQQSDPRTPLERATETFTEVMEAYKYGYNSHNGFVWCTSLEDAAEKAKASAIADGEERVFLVKKVGEVVNQPQVRMFD